MENSSSKAFVVAAWVCFALGLGGFVLGLWNATTLELNEKGFYVAVMLLGLYSSISLQKIVRDRADGFPASGIYTMVSWAMLAVALLLLGVGLLNASLALSEKGFYIMSFVLALFSAVAVQKSIRDSFSEGAEARASE